MNYFECESVLNRMTKHVLAFPPCTRTSLVAHWITKKTHFGKLLNVQNAQSKLNRFFDFKDFLHISEENIIPFSKG